MLALTAHDLSFAYPLSETIIRNLDAVFRSGRMVCIQAPSGRGKTTLLAMLGGLLIPGDGSIELDGRAMDPEALRSVSTWVLQSQNVLPNRTAIDNVALGAARQLGSWEEASSGAVALLDRLNLAHRQRAPAAQLSGGERQRVCVARALYRDVPVILADEPSANLDREATRQVVSALRYAADQNRIVIVASHDPDVGSQADDLLDGW